MKTVSIWAKKINITKLFSCEMAKLFYICKWIFFSNSMFCYNRKNINSRTYLPWAVLLTRLYLKLHIERSVWQEKWCLFVLASIATPPLGNQASLQDTAWTANHLNILKGSDFVTRRIFEIEKPSYISNQEGFFLKILNKLHFFST